MAIKKYLATALIALTLAALTGCASLPVTRVS